MPFTFFTLIMMQPQDRRIPVVGPAGQVAQAGFDAAARVSDALRRRGRLFHDTATEGDPIE